MVDRIHNHGASEQSADNAPVDIIALREGVCHTDHTLFREDPVIVKRPVRPHGCERQKSCPAEMSALQIFDQIFGCRLVICHNILQSSAEGCLDGRLVIFLRPDEVCHDTMNAGISVAQLHDLPDTVGITLIIFRHGAHGFQSGGFPVPG